jgi:hypothetical protein
MVGVDKLNESFENFGPCGEDMYNLESFESSIYL